MQTKRLLLWFKALLSILCLFFPLFPGKSVVAGSLQPFPSGLSSVQLTETVRTPTYSACGNPIVPVINGEFEQQVVELINQERAAQSLPPLKRIEELDQAARYHSADLGQDDYFDHDTYDRDGESLYFVCLWWQRIQNYYSGVRAENIAAGYTTPEAVVSAWMGSSGHRQNILSSNSDEVGVGFFQGQGGYNTYWTLDFGNRLGAYPLIINNEAVITQNPLVNLYIYGDWSEIRLRNNQDDWSEWQPFQNSMSWMLPMINGEHWVYAEMRQGEVTVTSQDSIILSGLTTMPELGNLPEVITFTYSIPDQLYIPEALSATPMNVGSPDLLEWEITTEGDWFVVSPTLGTTPQSFEVIPTLPVTTTDITLTGVITITAESASGVLCESYVVPLRVNLTEGIIKKLYIPLLENNLP